MALGIEEILMLSRNPSHRGECEEGGRAVNRSCGDDISICIEVKDGRITKAIFSGKGCALSIASAELICSNVEGEEIKKAEEISSDELIGWISEDLKKSPVRMKCALMPLEAFKKEMKRFAKGGT